MATPKGLGRGLSALISENYTQPASAAKAQGEPISGASMADIARLHPGKYQPRIRFDEASLAELANSIRQNGLVQPIIVRPSKQSGKFEIIAGERRWRAARMATLSEVPVVVREITDEQALEFALVENIQRQDLSLLEEAAGYQRLIDDFGYTQESLSGVIGKSRSHIANLLRLLTLPEEVREMLIRGDISMGHARALLTAQDPVILARTIISNNLNVRDAERFSKGAKPQTGKKTAAKTGGPKDPDILTLEASLSENLGIKVSINDRGQSGEIVLTYDSLAELDQILQRLGTSV